MTPSGGQAGCHARERGALATTADGGETLPPLGLLPWKLGWSPGPVAAILGDGWPSRRPLGSHHRKQVVQGDNVQMASMQICLISS